ncbi:MAG: hypothetical protein LBQ66_04030 [Planctomycetaceae bacterium]|nr:hypothetical protein [Planctomycetaceae bacterium]
MAVRLGDPVVGLRRRNRPAVGYPPYVCRCVLAFRSNFFGSITHRGGRDARVPVRRRFAVIVGCADIGRFGELVRFGDPVVGLRRRYSPRKPGGRLPALR